jgi:hypothetical protein
LLRRELPVPPVLMRVLAQAWPVLQVREQRRPAWLVRRPGERPVHP